MSVREYVCVSHARACIRYISVHISPNTQTYSKCAGAGTGRIAGSGVTGEGGGGGYGYSAIVRSLPSNSPSATPGHDAFNAHSNSDISRSAAQRGGWAEEEGGFNDPMLAGSSNDPTIVVNSRLVGSVEMRAVEENHSALSVKTGR